MATRTSSVVFDLLARDVNVSKTIDNIDKRSHSFIGTLGKVASAFGIAFSAGSIINFGTESVKQFSEAEEYQKKLSFAFSKFPALADTNQKALQKLNSELQKKTKFDDDEIAGGQAVLAQFKLTGTQLKIVTPLLLDYADKMGKDVPSAATDVGKALLGNAKALKSIGISYKSTGDSATDFTNITQLMRDKIGGFAEVEGKTSAGQLAILKNQIGEVEEKIGGALIPVLDDLVDFTKTDVLPALDGFSDWFVDYGLPNLEGFFGQVGKYGDVLGPAAAAVAILTGVQWGLNAAMDANPLGATILALEALIALTAVFFTDLGGFRTGVVNLYDGVATVILGILGVGASAFDGYVNTIIGGLNALIGGFNTAFAPIGLKLGQIPSVHTAKLIGAAGILVRGAGKAQAGLNLFDTTASILTGGQGPVSGSGSSRPVQAFAQGGIISAATLALIGEGSESEVVAPLSQLPSIAAAAGIGGGASGGQFTGTLVLDSGELMGVIRGEIRTADMGDVRTSKMGKQK